MNCHKHHLQDKFGLGMSFNVQALLKGRRHVLMIKFDKSGKTGGSSLVFQMFPFWQFQSEDQKGGKHEDKSKIGYI
jgi:hypothetical protein